MANYWLPWTLWVGREECVLRSFHIYNNIGSWFLDGLKFCLPCKAQGKNFIPLDDVGVFSPLGRILFAMCCIFVVTITFLGFNDLWLCYRGSFWKFCMVATPKKHITRSKSCCWVGGGAVVR